MWQRGCAHGGVEGVRELHIVRAIRTVHGRGNRPGASHGPVVALEGREERDPRPEAGSRFICLSIFRTNGLLVKQVGMLLPERTVADHVAVQHHGLVGTLRKGGHLLLREGEGNGIGLLLHPFQDQVPFLPDDHTSLLEELGFVVVVDSKSGKEEFVLVLAQGAPQSSLCRRLRFVSLQDERPEGCVVEIVDVRVGLSPGDVVADVLPVSCKRERHLVGGVNDDASIEGRRVLHGDGHILCPVEHVHCRELGDDRGENLGFAPIEQSRLPLEHEGVLVALANGQHAVTVGLEYFGRHLEVSAFATVKTRFINSKARISFGFSK